MTSFCPNQITCFVDYRQLTGRNQRKLRSQGNYRPATSFAATAVRGAGILVTKITVSAASGATTITAKGGTSQLTALVEPADATNKAVTWSVVSGGAFATVDASGLVTALDNGTVVIRVTAQDGSAVSGDFTITITGQGPGPCRSEPVRPTPLLAKTSQGSLGRGSQASSGAPGASLPLIAARNRFVRP